MQGSQHLCAATIRKRRGNKDAVRDQRACIRIPERNKSEPYSYPHLELHQHRPVRRYQSSSFPADQLKPRDFPNSALRVIPRFLHKHETTTKCQVALNLVVRDGVAR